MLDVTAVTLNIIAALSLKGGFFDSRVSHLCEGERPSLSHRGAKRGIPGLVFYVDENSMNWMAESI